MDLRHNGNPGNKIYSEKRFFQFVRLDYDAFSAILNSSMISFRIADIHSLDGEKACPADESDSKTQ